MVVVFNFFARTLDSEGKIIVAGAKKKQLFQRVSLVWFHAAMSLAKKVINWSNTKKWPARMIEFYSLN